MNVESLPMEMQVDVKHDEGTVASGQSPRARELCVRYSTWLVLSA
jgi:hypothetical protein